MQLSTSRLILREWVLEDLYALYKLASNPEVMRYLGGVPYTFRQTREALDLIILRGQMKPRRIYVLAVALAEETDRAIGRVGLYSEPGEQRVAYLGYDLHPDYWGQGITAEALEALIQFGFTWLNLHRITAQSHPENVAATRVLEKLGFRNEGYLRESHYEQGQWWDRLLYAVVEQEWFARHTAQRRDSSRQHGQGA